MQFNELYEIFNEFIKSIIIYGLINEDADYEIIKLI